VAIATFQQLEKLRPKLNYKSLHDQMIAEAELTVRHNWSDIAIHDRNRLRNIPIGHYCAWIVSELGSYLTPLWCSISERAKWEASPIAPIQVLSARWVNEDDPLTKNKGYLFNSGPYYQRCYLIRKTDDTGGGDIVPIAFDDLVDLCLLGNYKNVNQ